MNELRFAFRRLSRTPGFTITALLTLAVAIAASTSVFSVASRVLLEPLSFREPDRIVRLVATVEENGIISYPDYLDVVAQSGAFERASAFQEWEPAVSGSGDAEVLHGATVDSGFFQVLGIRPAAGRFFVPDDDKPGGDTIVVISDSLWRRKFGARPDVIGRTIVLDAEPMTIVGIVPPDYEEPYLLDTTRRIEVWTTNAIDAASDDFPRGARSFSAIARLRNGSTFEQARSRVRTTSASLNKLYPEDGQHDMDIIPLKVRITAGVRKPLWILFAAVLLLLLLACVNLANLFLARVERAGRDAAIRAAIGASGWDLARQVFAETFLICAGGSAAGGILASLMVRRIVAFGAGSIPRLAGAGLDLRVMLFVIAATFVTTLLVGLIPAIQMKRGRASLRVTSQATTAASPTIWMQSSLVVAQVAISIVLLVAAALVGRSLWNLMSVDKGIDDRNAVTFPVRIPRTDFRERPKVIEVYRRLEESLRRIPGVRAAGATTILPLGGDFTSMRYRIDGEPDLPNAPRAFAELRGVTPGYFNAVGLPVIAGRGITASDVADAPHVMVVDETFARGRWPDRSPIGVRIKTQGDVFEIVGVVRSSRLLKLAEAPVPVMYVPHAQAQSYRTMSVIVRGGGSAATLAPSIRSTLFAISKDTAIGEIRPLHAVVAGSVSPERFRALLLLAFGASALLLAVLGVGGTLAYVTSRREREMGVRMALGATSAQILSLVLSRGVKLVAIGIGVGAVFALLAARTLQSMLFGVGAADPVSFVAVATALLVAGVAASAFPAARAARTNPIQVMRAE